MRLVKYLANAGVASRRKAEKLIAAGEVKVAGKVITAPACSVSEDSCVTVSGKQVHFAPRVVYLLHKPTGVVSTAHDPQGRPTVCDLIECDYRLYPVGRLDYNTSGLILLTNDGELANLLTHPRYQVPKTYLVTVENPPVTPKAIELLRKGVKLDDGYMTAPAEVQRLADNKLQITLREGKKRQVRRMCLAVGHPVSVLQRIAFGSLRLGSLKEGKYRRLTSTEVTSLRTAVGD